LIDLTTTVVAKILKKRFSWVGKYLSDVKRESLSSDTFLEVKSLLAFQKKINSIKASGGHQNTSESFFFKKSNIFSELLLGKREEFIKDFLTMSEKSLELLLMALRKDCQI